MKKTPDYKPEFEFKAKLQAQIRSQSTSLIPLFMMADEAVRVKEEVDKICKGESY